MFCSADCGGANSVIHPTAIIDADAVLGQNVKIGPYCVVGPGVVLAIMWF